MGGSHVPYIIHDSKDDKDISQDFQKDFINVFINLIWTISQMQIQNLFQNLKGI